jgi:Lar family restriction alleviation protein
MHCPFCGDDEHIRPYVFQSGGAWNARILCDGCDAHGPTVASVHQRTAKETAINSWNTRIPYDEDLALRTAFKLG